MITEDKEHQREIWRRASKKYRVENYNKVKKMITNYKLKNIDLVRKKNMDYRKNHKQIKLYTHAGYLKYKEKHLLRGKTKNRFRVLKEQSKCLICGSKDRLHFHHLTYQVDNFIIVCSKCHHKIHRKINPLIIIE